MALEKDKWVGGGHSKFWGLPETHVFQPAFVMHDKLVDDQLKAPLSYTFLLTQSQRGKLFFGTPLTRGEVDGMFLKYMLLLANGSIRLKLQARLFHALARAWALTVRREEK